jgi:hypothetical protein
MTADMTIQAQEGGKSHAGAPLSLEPHGEHASMKKSKKLEPQKKFLHDSGRFAIFAASGTALTNLFFEQRRVRYNVARGIPEDAIVKSMSVRPGIDVVEIVLYSASFEIVAEHEPLPIIAITIHKPRGFFRIIRDWYRRLVKGVKA